MIQWFNGSMVQWFNGFRFTVQGLRYMIFRVKPKAQDVRDEVLRMTSAASPFLRSTISTATSLRVRILG
jgi:hypothetical protein